MATTTAPVTFAEFEQLPDVDTKRELLDGEVIDLPPAKRIHSAIVMALVELLLRCVPRARICAEGGYRMGAGFLIPDVSVLHPNQPLENGYVQGAPLLAVEVASEANTARQLDRKVSRYLQHGAHEVWIVYPETSSMMVFHASGAVERITGPWTSPASGLAFDIAGLIGTCAREAQ